VSSQFDGSYGGKDLQKLKGSCRGYRELVHRDFRKQGGPGRGIGDGRRGLLPVLIHSQGKEMASGGAKKWNQARSKPRRERKSVCRSSISSEEMKKRLSGEY